MKNFDIKSIFFPKSFTTLKGYNKETFINDLNAGVIVGIVALPLAIAFAIASGVTPEKGLITAIISGFIISAFGGSRFQIGGPTGAFIIIVYNIIQQYGITGLTIATLMAGVILILMGFAKLGSLIKFIPYPVTVGFTSGIAVLIFTTQIKDFLGIEISKMPAEFHSKIIAIVQNLHTINFYELGISVLCLLILIYWPRITKKIPGSLIAIILSTLLVLIFNLPVSTIGSIYGEIPSNMPSPTFYQIDIDMIKNLIMPATTIALLAAIESLLSAVVADGMTGGKHRSNTELIAQGIANFITPMFGGIPATGAIARTATNIKNGAKTPVAGMIHALTLLLIMLFFGSYAKLIPMPALAAILVVVAYNMSEWRNFVHLLKSPKSDIVVLLTTFLLTIIFDLTIAIQIGILLALLLFMKRMSEVSGASIITKEFDEPIDDIPDPNAISKKVVPEDVEVFEITGPFFFGAAAKFKEELNIIKNKPKIIILRMRSVPAIDATGLKILEEYYHDSKKNNIQLILSGIHAQPLFAITGNGFLDVIGEGNVLGNIDDALDRAREVLGLEKIGRPEDFIPTVKRDLN